MAISLVLGVLSGIAEASLRDRAITIISVLTTSLPEFASATFLVAIFVYWLELAARLVVLLQRLFLDRADPAGRRPGHLQFRLLHAHDAGLDGRGHDLAICAHRRPEGPALSRVVMRHALRNALIAPFTVMILQLNYLLSGVVVTEVFFAYDGYGKALYDAAMFGDVYLILAGAMIAVVVAVLSQFISDIGYTYLNPRIRFA